MLPTIPAGSIRPERSPRRLLRLAGALLLALALAAIAGSHAVEPSSAATRCSPHLREDADLAVSATPSKNITPSTKITFQLTGTLPDHSCAGDTVVVSIDPLVSVTYDITLPILSKDGVDIGTAHIDASNRSVTYTFNDYVETHTGVSWVAYAQTTLVRSIKPSNDYGITWTVGQQELVTDVTTASCVGCSAPITKPAKFATLNEGQTPETVSLTFQSAAALRAGEVIRMTDRVAAGQQIDCATSATAGSVAGGRDTWGGLTNRSKLTDGDGYSYSVVSCDSEALTVQMTAKAAGEYLLVFSKSTVTRHLDSYSDTLEVGQGGTTRSASATARRAAVGVGGSGVQPLPAIEIEKYSARDGQDETAAGQTASVLDPSADEPVTIIVRNTGKVDLTDVAVTDKTVAGTGKLTGLSCDFTAVGGPSSGTAFDGPLGSGESFTCSGTLAALGSGAEHTDEATVSAKSAGGAVTDRDEWAAYTEADQAVLLLRKTGTVGTGGVPTAVAAAGDSIHYTFEVRNGGQSPVRGVSVDDPSLGAVQCPSSVLAAGEEETCFSTRTRVVTQGDIDSGKPVINTATVTGVGQDGVARTSETTESTGVAQAAPGITAKKTGVILESAHQAGVAEGDHIRWDFTVTNSGNVSLTNVAVEDPDLGPVTCAHTTLAPAAVTTCSGPIQTVTRSDVGSAKVENHATARAEPPALLALPDVRHAMNASVPVGPANAELTLRKTATIDAGSGRSAQARPAPTAAEAGDEIRYGFTVTNTGDRTVEGIKIRDAGLGGRITCGRSTLAPGLSTECSASRTHLVTRSDVLAGKVTNTATVSGRTSQGQTPTDTASVLTRTIATSPTALEPRRPSSTSSASSGAGPLPRSGDGNHTGNQSPPQGILAFTGTTLSWWLIVPAGAAIIAGGVVLVARRRRRSSHPR